MIIKHSPKQTSVGVPRRHDFCVGCHGESDMRLLYILAVVALLAAIVGCSKQTPPQSSQSQQLGLHIAHPPTGAEPCAFMIILTNSQPPPMRSLIAITKTMKYEWHKVADDGTASTVRGVVPTEIYEAVLTEWRTMSGRSGVDSKSEQAVYVGSVDGAHPPQVQRLLDQLSK